MVTTNKPVSDRPRQLTPADIEAVSGGLNPQPLPPQERPMALNLRALTALRYTSVFVR